MQHRLEDFLAGESLDLANVVDQLYGEGFQVNFGHACFVFLFAHNEKVRHRAGLNLFTTGITPQLAQWRTVSDWFFDLPTGD